MRAALLLSLLLPILATAETAYVTDNLQLGLHQAEDTSDRAFRTLNSGQELEVLSRDRNYANVRLPDGSQGYVKAAYLVFEKPAKLIVDELRASSQQLRVELEQTRSEFAAPAATIKSLEQQLSDKDAALESNSSMLASLTSEVEGYRSQFAAFRNSLPLTWVAGAMFVCLLAGFLVGAWWFDYRSRKRHGGLRIF